MYSESSPAMYQGDAPLLDMLPLIGADRKMTPQDTAVVPRSAMTRTTPRLKNDVKYEGRIWLLRGRMSALRKSVRNSYWSQENQREHVLEMTGTRRMRTGVPASAMVR